MRCIVIRAEHCPKPLARALVDNTQKFPLGPRAIAPMLCHTDLAPIFQDECSNVDRFGPGVGGKSSRSGNIAARIAAHGFDPGQRAAQISPRSAIDAKTRPCGEGLGNRAGQRAYIADCDAALISRQAVDLYRAELMATWGDMAIGEGRKARACTAQIGKAHSGRRRAWI